MNDLLPEDRALLDLARDVHEPSRSDRARVRTALIVQLGVGTGLATAASTSTAAAAGAGLAVTGGAAVGVAAKVLVGFAIVGAIGAGGAVVYRAGRSPRLNVVASIALSQPAPVFNAVPVATTEHEEPATVLLPPPPALVPLSIPAIDRGPSARSGPARPTLDELESPVAAPRLSPTTLESETRLIRAGIAALHGGDPAGALAFFDEHARSYPNGALAEERAVEGVTALCDLGRVDEANRAASAFVVQHPGSPLAARVSAGCLGAPRSPTNP
jgi:hypothetical protein